LKPLLASVVVGAHQLVSDDSNDLNDFNEKARLKRLKTAAKVLDAARQASEKTVKEMSRVQPQGLINPLLRWDCPKCLTRITSEDYNKVLWPVEPYRCRFCGLTLVVDKATDRLIAAPTKAPPKPAQQF
jgi:hypothetical protein